MQPQRQDHPDDATLEVGVDQHFDGPAVELGYVARLIDVTEGRAREERETRSGVVLPVGGGYAATLKVRPGRYILEAVSPAGDVIDADVVVGPNERKPVRLEGEASPHEWLGYQTVSGNLDRFSPGFAPVAKPRRLTPWLWLAAALAAMLVAAGLAFFAVRTSPMAPDVVLQSSITGSSASMATLNESLFNNWQILFAVLWAASGVWLFFRIRDGDWFRVEAGGEGRSKEHRFDESSISPPAEPSTSEAARVDILLVHTPRGAAEWAAVRGGLLKAADFVTPSERAAALALSPQIADATWRTFRIPGQEVAGAPTGAVASWCLDLSDGDRGGLVKLALPWLQPDLGSPAELEVLAPADPASGGRISATVRDPRYATLLGYLAGGRISEAQAILEDAKGALFEKMANPYAAAAGGYVLLASATTFEDVDAEWRQWLTNLDAFYPWLPDAATLQGINLSQTHTPGARDKLLQAHARGIPVFTEGLRRLRDGLTYVLEDDADGRVAAALADVDEISARCDPQQIFTCLRLGR